jgi:hypothetical protein
MMLIPCITERKYLIHTIAQAMPRMITFTMVRKIFLDEENQTPLFITSQKMAGNPSVPR